MLIGSAAAGTVLNGVVSLFIALVVRKVIPVVARSQCTRFVRTRVLRVLTRALLWLLIRDLDARR
jgi:uncharacterized protein YqhQ